MKRLLLDKNEIPALSAFFAAAMEADPLYAALIPDPAERRRVLPVLFEKYFTDYRQALTVLRTGNGAGVICWCAGEAEGEERFPLPAEFRPYYAEMNRGAAPDYFKDYLLLDLLAVAPEARGKGCGGALVSAFTAACAEAGKTGVAEIYQAANVPFYERCGFRAARRVPRGGLTAYLMEYKG